MEDEKLRKLIANQVLAIANRDIDEAVKNYSDNVRLFDVIGKLEHEGIEAVKKRLGEWFNTFDESYDPNFETVGLEIHADHLTAFSNGLNHIKAKLRDGNELDMFWRETLCWRKFDDIWKVVVAHSSVPFDAGSGKASTGLTPRK